MRPNGNADRPKLDINAQIHAPFNLIEEDQLMLEAQNFVEENGLEDYQSHFLKGAFIAQNDRAFFTQHPPGGLSLTTKEADCLQQEIDGTNRWRHPRALWQLVGLCAIGAAVQGWDESAIDGGKIFSQSSGCLRFLSGPRNLGEDQLKSSVCSTSILQICIWHPEQSEPYRTRRQRSLSLLRVQLLVGILPFSCHLDLTRIVGLLNL